MPIDPLTLLKLAEILKKSGEKIINEAKLDYIIAKLDELTVLCSEIILRDIRGAFKSLQDYLACNGSSNQWQIIDHIEQSLLNNTGLDPASNIGSIKAADVVAMSYFGLAFIYSFRGNTEVAERYIFRMFESTSRLARKELAPNVFEKVIRPHCKKCYAAHNYRVGRQAKAGDYVLQAGRGLYCALATLGAGIVLNAHPSLRGGIPALRKHVEIVWDDGAKAKEWKSVAELDELLENSLDIQSGKVAKDILSGLIQYK
jgi:hypothetical protein